MTPCLKICSWSIISLTEFEMKSFNVCLQVRVEQRDEGWIYGPIFCKAINSRGERQIELQLTQASKCRCVCPCRIQVVCK